MFLSQSDLTRILPQTYPFLMIDEIIEIKKGESLTAIKNITGNEWIFQNQMFQLNHMPEPLIIEAAAQAALVLYHQSRIENLKIQPKYILGIISSKLLDCFAIGDQIVIEAFATKMLYIGGFSDILLYKKNVKIGKVSITYRVLRENL